jgi:hypothetical protein
MTYCALPGSPAYAMASVLLREILREVHFNDSASRMTFLHLLVQSSLDWVSPAGGAVIRSLVEAGSVVEHADLLARRLGFRNRHNLARLLKGEGLPPLQELRGWIRLLGWVLEWEQRRTSFCSLALRSGTDPAVCYRLVRKLTGVGWSIVKARGSAWVLLKLHERCNQLRPADMHSRSSPRFLRA